jgi:hypothetical protein
VHVLGDVFLQHLKAESDIRFLGAHIDGDLDCSDAALHSKGNSLDADRAEIKGGVFLTGEFSASGKVRFNNAIIGGDFECYGASMGSLSGEGTQCKGDLIWAGIQNPGRTELDLFGARFGRIHDDHASWPSKGNLRLEGLVYQDLILRGQATSKMIAENELAPSLPLNAEDRIEWLRRQSDRILDKPQPWMQLAKLIEANGDRDGAKRVIYEFSRQQARSEKPLFRSATYIYDKLDEQPFRILVPILGLWAVGSLVFWRARRMNAMAPTEKDAYDEFEGSRKLPSQYSRFNPAVYALENVLPVVKLGQDDAWGPNPQAKPESWFPNRPRLAWTRWLPGFNYRWLSILRWTLILFGWALALILASAIGERFKP